MAIMAHLEKRQSEMLKERADFFRKNRETLRLQAEKGEAVDEQIEKLISAIAVKCDSCH